jgi:molybdenum cofactor cytidylyltransferase
MSTSIGAGVASLPAMTDGVVICLGDMPDVGPTVIDPLISAFAPEAGADIIAPCRHGRRGNPVLWGRRHFDKLLRLTGDSGAKQNLAANAEGLVEIEIGDEAIFLDLDSEEMLKAYRPA